MNEEDKRLNEILEAVSKGATHIVATPEDIKKLQERGIPIESKFISYEEYAENLFAQKKKDAVALLSKLPMIDLSIADGVIANIYEEIRSSYALSIFTSTIVNSILLLEYSMRARLFEERLKKNPKASWSKLEELTMGTLIWQLSGLKIVTKDEKKKLMDFNKNLRNPYLHINVHKLSKGIIIPKLPSVNVKTGQVTEMENVEVSKHKFLWFGAKKFFDKHNVQPILNFCIDWTNKLLAKKIAS